MAHDRPVALTIAGGLMFIAAMGYAVGAVAGILGGGFYPTILGGLTRVDGAALFTGYAPLAPIAAVLSWEIMHERSLRTVYIGFSAWFAIAALDIAILGGIQMALSIAFSGLVALVLVVAERHRFADVGRRA